MLVRAADQLRACTILHETFEEALLPHAGFDQLKQIADDQFGGVVERHVTSCLYRVW